VALKKLIDLDWNNQKVSAMFRTEQGKFVVPLESKVEWETSFLLALVN
jgi:hypothetical protein